MMFSKLVQIISGNFSKLYSMDILSGIFRNFNILLLANPLNSLEEDQGDGSGDFLFY